MRIRKCHQRKGSFQQCFGIWRSLTCCKEFFTEMEFVQMEFNLTSGKRDRRVALFVRKNGMYVGGDMWYPAGEEPSRGRR